MNPFEIKHKYLDFFLRRKHSQAGVSTLVPENDPSTLFTGSGMQPMIPYLLGEPHPLGNRLVNAQRCLRVQDIEEVGDNRHSTFFEMLGNWSLGGYSKLEQLGWTFEFLVRIAGLDPARIYVSIFDGDGTFSRDEESIGIWRELFSQKGIEAEFVSDPIERGMRGGRIFGYGPAQNWWSRSGLPERMPVGEPGGTDSEIYFDFGAHLGIHERSRFRDRPCHPACDCGRFFELGNNVFMDLRKTGEHSFAPLERPNLDFGGGFERVLAASTLDPDIFTTSLFKPLLDEISRLTGRPYGESDEVRRSFRVMSDHLRASSMLIADGVRCSNKDQGYVLRRLLRRAIRFGRRVGAPSESYSRIARIVIDQYGAEYPHLVIARGDVVSQIDREVEKFESTVTKGLHELDALLVRGAPGGRELFFIYETYGLPFEMSVEELRDRDASVAHDELLRAFEEEKARHQLVSQSGATQKFAGGLADHGLECRRYHTATHLLLRGLQLVISPEIHQHGSNITSSRLRFDINLDRVISPDEISRIEQIVNERIAAGLEVDSFEMPKEQAKLQGVEGMFWEKYPETVKVFRIKDRGSGEVFSMELCGGPHAGNTGELAEMGTFKILSQESIGGGKRRLKAVLA